MASGARWTISIRVVERVIGFVSTLVLARLLAPADFGVVAMGTAIQGILATLTEFGFTKAIIRMQRPQHAHYSSAFTLNAITSALVAVAMLIAIPVAQLWYDDARVAPVLATLAVMSLIGGFRNLGLARYERALDFRPFFLIALARKLSSFTIGAICALMWHDYRALLAGMLLGSIVEIAATYRLTRFRPRFTLARAKELMGFSVWWLAGEMATMFGRRGQDLLIGQQLGAATLGQYAVALDLATMPTTEIVAPVMRAVYPGYMQMKDDVGRLYSAFVRVWGVVALLAIPSAVGIACIAPLMTLVVLGPKWLDAAPYMGALALIGALQALNSCYWPMLLTRLGPRTVFRLAALGVALTIPVFGVVLWLAGLMPAIAAWIGCGVVMLFVGAKWLLDDLRQSMKPLLKALIRPVIASTAMAASLLAVQAVFPTAGKWTIGLLFLLGLVAFGAVVYAAALICLWLLAGRPHEGESELLFLAMSRLRKA
jgi:O-antigen/teichoic acid export membrane protein